MQDNERVREGKVKLGRGDVEEGLDDEGVLIMRRLGKKPKDRGRGMIGCECERVGGS